MSAQEFSEWFVYMSHEQLLPGADRIRHAQLQAAVFTAGGVKSPRGWGGWTSRDFGDPDVWAEPIEIPALPLAKQIDLMNGWIK